METDAKYYAKTTKSALALDINDENAYNNKKMCLGETQFEKNRNILLFWQVKESMGKIRKLRNYNRFLLQVERLLNAVKIELFKVVKCGKKQENVGNSYFIPALFIYHTPTL